MPKKKKKKRKKRRKKSTPQKQAAPTTWWCCVGVPATVSQSSANNDKCMVVGPCPDTARPTWDDETSSSDGRVQRDVTEIQLVAKSRVECELDELWGDIDTSSDDFLDINYITKKWTGGPEEFSRDSTAVGGPKNFPCPTAVRGPKEFSCSTAVGGPEEFPCQSTARLPTEEPKDTAWMNIAEKHTIKSITDDQSPKSSLDTEEIDKVVDPPNETPSNKESVSKDVAQKEDANSPELPSCENYQPIETRSSSESEGVTLILNTEPGEEERGNMKIIMKMTEDTNCFSEIQDADDTIPVENAEESKGETLENDTDNRTIKQAPAEKGSVQIFSEEETETNADSDDQTGANDMYPSAMLPKDQSGDTVPNQDDGQYSVFEFEDGISLFSPKSSSIPDDNSVIANFILAADLIAEESKADDCVSPEDYDLSSEFTAKDDVESVFDIESVFDLDVELIEPKDTKSVKTLTEEIIIGTETNNLCHKYPSRPTSPKEINFSTIPKEAVGIIANETETKHSLDEKELLKQTRNVFKETSQLPLPQTEKAIRANHAPKTDLTKDLKLESKLGGQVPHDTIPEQDPRCINIFQALHKAFEPSGTLKKHTGGLSVSATVAQSTLVKEASKHSTETTMRTEIPAKNDRGHVGQTPERRFTDPQTQDQQFKDASLTYTDEYSSEEKDSIETRCPSDFTEEPSEIKDNVETLCPPDSKEKSERMDSLENVCSGLDNMSFLDEAPDRQPQPSDRQLEEHASEESSKAVEETDESVRFHATVDSYGCKSESVFEPAGKKHMEATEYSCSKTKAAKNSEKDQDNVLNTKQVFYFNVSTVRRERNSEEFDLELDFSTRSNRQENVKESVHTTRLTETLDRDYRITEETNNANTVIKRKKSKSPVTLTKTRETQRKHFNITSNIAHNCTTMVMEEETVKSKEKIDTPETNKTKSFIHQEIFGSAKVKIATSVKEETVEHKTTVDKEEIASARLLCTNQNANSDPDQEIPPLSFRGSSQCQKTETDEDKGQAEQGGIEEKICLSNLVARAKLDALECRTFLRRHTKKEKVPTVSLSNHVLMYSCWDGGLDKTSLRLQSLMADGDFGRTYKGMYRKDHVILTFYRRGFPTIDIDLLLKLCSPFTSNVLAHLENVDSICLIQPYFEFGTLHNLMKQDAKRAYLKEAQSEFVLACLLHGIDHLYSNGIVHGNITPKHVLLNDLMYPVIGDFTMSYPVSGQPIPRMNDFDPNYAAPERIGCIGLGIGTDIFSAGCIAYQMVEGEPPYKGDTRDDTMANLLQLTFRPYFTRVYYERIHTVIGSCIRRNAKERMTVGQQVRQAFLERSEIKNLVLQTRPSPLIPAVSQLYADNKGSVSKYLFRENRHHTI